MLSVPAISFSLTYTYMNVYVCVCMCVYGVERARVTLRDEHKATSRATGHYAALGFSERSRRTQTVKTPGKRPIHYRGNYYNAGSRIRSYIHCCWEL
jgi:hypothetical protein